MAKKTLTAKTIRLTVATCILMGLVALVIGVGMYGYTLVDGYISRSFNIARHGSENVRWGTDSVGLSRRVMEIYRGLTEEQRSWTGTEKYRQLFAGLNLEEDDPTYSTYKVLVHMLRSFVIDVDYVYLAMYDQDTEAMVYIVDSSADDPIYPGEWESVNRQGMMKFLNWNGEGRLYDIGQTEKYGWLCTAGYPIRDTAGEVCAFLLVDVTLASVFEHMAKFALQLAAALVAVTALITWYVSRRMKTMVVKPIDAISGAALAYVRDKRSGAASQEHFSALGIHSGDELEKLGQIMADMERDIAEHERQLTRIAAQEERIGTELSLATQIQTSMLPHTFPAFPERQEFDIYASMDPAKEVGGDFYDYFLVDADHLCLVIADVSGKGIPAALFMMACKILLQSYAAQGNSPAQILARANETICANNEAQMFVTVWLGILELSTGKLTCANAGHEYPALRQPGQSFELYKDRHGFVIGGMEGIQYRQYELYLQPGSKLFVYTDGLPEATNAGQELFGTERMICALNTQPEAAPEAVLRSVRRAVDAFVQNAEQFDDLTMLCVEYKG